MKTWINICCVWLINKTNRFDYSSIQPSSKSDASKCYTEISAFQETDLNNAYPVLYLQHEYNTISLLNVLQ